MQVFSRWLQFAACCFLLSNLLLASAHAATSEPATAASFECNGAVGVDTDIICSDALLRRADGDLGRLYHSLVSETSNQERLGALRNDERAWVLRRNSQCKVSKSLKLNVDQLPTYVDCFLLAYDERMDDLRRMHANPDIDPATISNPIRKSTFGDAVGEITLPAGALVETGLMAADSGRAVLGFKSDNSLVVLGSQSEQPELDLFVWKQGQALQTITASSAISPKASLCVTSKAVVLLSSSKETTASMVVQDKLEPSALAKLPAEVRRACGISTERDLIGNTDGTFALDLGPRSVSTTDSTRFVSAVDASGSHALSPPIRIDRRFPPKAYFNPGDGKFVVIQGPRPQDARAIAARSWANSGCGAFWQVDAATRRSSRSCIPFGSYVDETNEDLVIPLQTRAGLYFAIASHGLFKVVDGAAKRVVAGPVSQPHIAPDDCSIGFVGSAGKTSSQHRVMLLNTCALP